MIKNGKGGSETTSGLKFEERISLHRLFDRLSNYDVKDNDVYYNNKRVATFYKKNELYSKLLEPKKVKYLDYIFR